MTHGAAPSARLIGAVLSASCNRASEHRAQAQEGTTTKGAASKKSSDNPGANAGGGCSDVPDEDQLASLLKQAPEKGEAGGMLGGRFEWAAVINRAGELCAVAVSTSDPAAAWPGAQAIAKAKAFTANAFSTETTPLSTARLYTLSQPGHSLRGAANGNPFDPQCLAGLGASGDTPCADHEIAKRIRDGAGLNPEKGSGADDIQYSNVDGASSFTHPLCPNTWRNGKKIGDEPPAQGY